jgi:hypothetical protein
MTRKKAVETLLATFPEGARDYEGEPVGWLCFQAVAYCETNVKGPYRWQVQEAIEALVGERYVNVRSGKLYTRRKQRWWSPEARFERKGRKDERLARGEPTGIERYIQDVKRIGRERLG